MYTSINQQKRSYNNLNFLSLMAFFLFITFAANKTNAALIITDVNSQTANGELFVDINSDNISDIVFNVYKDSDYDSAVAWSLTSPESEHNPNQEPNLLNFAMGSSFGINRYSEGDVISSAWQYWYDYGYIYNDFGDGEWSSIGTSGFLGFSFEEDDGLHYGWMEITRGSVSISRIAYQTVAGAGAAILGQTSNPTTSVPEPATGLLLFSGFMLLMLRRNA